MSPERKKLNYGVVAGDFSLTRGGRLLIKEANFAIYPGRKVALIGRNGGGKTTLLETIVAVAQKAQLPDATEFTGRLEVLPQTRLGYLPQEVQLNFQGTVSQYLDLCAKEVAQTYQEWEKVIEKLQEGSSSLLLEEYGELMERMNVLDAWDYPRRKEMIVKGLGFSSDYLARGIDEISGGEANKVALAGVLVSSPNLVLLDEPTNNLDFMALKFLEEWVREGDFSLLLVSHDRRFLDRTVQEILEIDEENLNVSHFGGNYSFYSERKKEMFEAQQRAYEEQKRRREKLEEASRQLKMKALQFESISSNAFYRAKGASLAKQARVQLARIEKELSAIPEPKPPRRPFFLVKENSSQGTLLSVSNLCFSYSPDNSLIENFSFSLRGGERMGIVGPNGVGKTTLLRLILGEIKPQQGEVRLVKNVSYLPQKPLSVNRKQPVLDFFRDSVAVSEEEAREILGRVLFTDVSYRKIGDFSSGEIRRIQLASLFASSPELIILDEPTNHLDILTIEMLEDALRRFKGGVLVVSHDEWFFRNIEVEKLLVFDGKKIIQQRVFPEELSLEKFLVAG